MKINLKQITFAFCLITCQLLAQKNPKIINSGEIIKAGVELHDDQKYLEALAKYAEVSENDTNYQLACYEAILSCSKLKDPDLAAKWFRRGIESPSDDYDLSMYAAYGSVLNESGRHHEASSIFDTIIQLFPNSANGRYNKALSLVNEKKYDEALAMSKESILMNPFNHNGHLAYGIVNYTTGNLVPAYFGLSTFLLTEPTDSRRFFVWKLLSSMAENKDTFIQLQKKRYVFKDLPDYSAVEEIVISNIATSKEYKAKTDLRESVFLQLQAITDVLMQGEIGNDFCSELYVKLYKNVLQDEKDFEPMTYLMASGFDVEKIQKYQKKNTSATSKMASNIVEMFNKIAFNRSLKNWEANERKGVGYFISNNVVNAKGEYQWDNKAKKGLWQFYNRFGNLSEETMYNAEGKSDGLSKTYYPNGKLKSEMNYINDEVDGPYKNFFDNGNMSYEGSAKSNKRHGPFKRYHPNGNLAEIGSYDQGVMTGENKEYFFTGPLSQETTLVDEKMDGKATRYYRSGNKDVEYVFKEGKKEGPYKKYYDHGTLAEEGNFVNNQLEGEYKEYYYNGKLSQFAIYHEGELDSMVTYYFTGEKMGETPYKNGKKQGVSVAYNRQGKVWNRIEYNKGYYKKIIYYDASTGNEIISQDLTDKNQNTVMIYDDLGIKTEEAICNREGKYNGLVKTFYENGQLKKEQMFVDGNSEGLSTTYHMNGKKSKEYLYAKDQLNGPFSEWHPNGSIAYEGNYIDGELEGDWYQYNTSGKLTSHEYYISGNNDGYSYTYEEDGRLLKRRLHQNKILMSETYYDTLGAEMRHVPVFNAKELVLYSPLNIPFRTIERTGNVDEGKVTNYDSDKQVTRESNARGNSYHGTEKVYYPNGKLKTEGQYVNGNKHGVWKHYYYDGTLEMHEIYHDGDNVDSGLYFHPNGTLDRVIYYEHELRHGLYRKYDPFGQLMYTLRYDRGTIMSYSYMGADNVMVPEIPFKNGAGNLKATYPDGKLAADVEFENSVIHGKFKTFTSQGKPILDETFSYGRYVGKSIEYHANGQLRMEMNYTNDELNGEVTEYNDQGKILRKEIYVNGERHGECIYSDAAGNPQYKIWYYYDLPYKKEKLQ